MVESTVYIIRCFTVLEFRVICIEMMEVVLAHRREVYRVKRTGLKMDLEEHCRS